MKKYDVRFEKQAQKALKKMDSYQKRIILAWIKKNLLGTNDPRIHGKPLTANHSGKW